MKKRKNSYRLYNKYLFKFLIFLLITSTNPSLKSNDNTSNTKKTKILVTETYFPPITSTAALNQITGLIDLGYDVYIHTKKKGDLEWAHPDIEEYNLMDKVYFNKIPPDIRDFDIILCQFGYRATEWVKIKKKYKLKAKLIACFRGCDITKHVKKNPLKYNELFKIGDRFLPVCSYFKNKLIELGCNPKRIKVLGSAIDCQKFEFKARQLAPNETIHITSICRLVEKKGLRYSIKAVAKLLKKYPNIEYSIFGFGEKQEVLQALIDELEVQDNIKLLGRISQDQVAKVLNETHLFVLTPVTASNGDQEGIPNVLKEAMVCGIPVISTYHAGIPELIEHEKTGFLVQEKSVSELTDKIEYLINHPETWELIGTSARKRILQKYNKKRLSNDLVEILENILKKK